MIENVSAARPVLVPTPRGDARVLIELGQGGGKGARALVVLGHGAGGSIDAPDLAAVAAAVRAAGMVVVRVEQPYRVAGRRAPAPAAALDEAWCAVVRHIREQLRTDPRARVGPVSSSGAGLPLVVGGRSSGARVACRTAVQLGAAAVVALAFPVRPPGRPDRDRLSELALPTVPALVVQGERDRFGMPPPAPGRTVEVIPAADHALRRDPGAVAAAVTGWLAGLNLS